MIRNIMSLVTTVILLLFAVNCQSSDKYEEAREIYEEYVPAMEKYLDAVDKVANPQELAKAINVFADDMEGIAPKLKKLAEKYPDLADEPNVPPEYADLEKKSEALGQRFGQSFTRIAPFMDDPEVEKANERLGQVMESMSPEEE